MLGCTDCHGAVNVRRTHSPNGTPHHNRPFHNAQTVNVDTSQLSPGQIQTLINQLEQLVALSEPVRRP